MKRKYIFRTLITLAVISSLLFHACAPLREFSTTPTYDGNNNFNYSVPSYDSMKKTVVVIANNDGTELFDMMAPFYLFNATGKANVYIVAKNKAPITIKKGIFVLPQSTFTEIDSLQIKPDVMVIPFLAAADSASQDPVIINWIRSHYNSNTSILSICDGAATAAATGLFDGKPITAHASDYEGIKKNFSRPQWLQNKSVVNSGNLFSTAGVSNATEGSLMVIKEVFGDDVMHSVMKDIRYAYPKLKIEHMSSTFHFSDKTAAGKKILFSRNKRVGVFLQEGINEFELAAVMDTYNRTFPKKINSYAPADAPVKTKYGLVIVPTGKSNNGTIDEMHIIQPSNTAHVVKAKHVVEYNSNHPKYIIDECLARIRAEHGGSFERVVKLMLDYN